MMQGCGDMQGRGDEVLLTLGVVSDEEEAAGDEDEGEAGRWTRQRWKRRAVLGVSDSVMTSST
jgi:hypothetical protein